MLPFAVRMSQAGAAEIAKFNKDKTWTIIGDFAPCMQLDG